MNSGGACVHEATGRLELFSEPAADRGADQGAPGSRAGGFPCHLNNILNIYIHLLISKILHIHSMEALKMSIAQETESEISIK